MTKSKTIPCHYPSSQSDHSPWPNQKLFPVTTLPPSHYPSSQADHSPWPNQKLFPVTTLPPSLTIPHDQIKNYSLSLPFLPVWPFPMTTSKTDYIPPMTTSKTIPCHYPSLPVLTIPHDTFLLPHLFSDPFTRRRTWSTAFTLSWALYRVQEGTAKTL